MIKIFFVFAPCMFLLSCNCKTNPETKNQITRVKEKKEFPVKIFNEDGKTVLTRFELPKGYVREKTQTNSFAYYLQHLPLKPHGAFVHHYDGNIKANVDAYCAVVDLPINGNANHHCADAVMRLRAEYLFNQKRFNEIEFWYGNNGRLNYQQFLAGKQPTAKNLWTYLEKVFAYAGTLSLEQQLKKKDLNLIEIGDVFIKGGSPGHVVIVVDKCVNEVGKIKFILAQSYMPAQDIQIIVGDDGKSPWYDLEFGNLLRTAEYDFTSEQLKCF